jgi:hypothetical protein
VAAVTPGSLDDDQQARLAAVRAGCPIWTPWPATSTGGWQRSKQVADYERLRIGCLRG